jgi:hypothetical protein
MVMHVSSELNSTYGPARDIGYQKTETQEANNFGQQTSELLEIKRFFALCL